MVAIINIANFIATHPLTRDQKLRALGRFVRWQAQSRLQREVIVPWIEGTLLAVRRGMAGATGNIYCGLHEFEDMAFLLHFLRPEDAFADIGANIGSYTVLASGVCRAKSFAFEPDPTTFAALSRNIALNRLNAIVDCRECALGSQVGKIDLTVGLDTVNRVVTDKTGPTRVVAMDTLDNGLAGERPSLIKLDVEGFESEVLKGAGRTLSCYELKAVITEDRSPAVTSALQAAGFVEHSYDPFTRKLDTEQRRHQRQNSLFVRDHDFVQQRLIGATRVRILNRSL
jgi:FkbM family methyltransferase